MYQQNNGGNKQMKYIQLKDNRLVNLEKLIAIYVGENPVDRYYIHYQYGQCVECDNGYKEEDFGSNKKERDIRFNQLKEILTNEK